jgi:hypothetical protein
MTTLLFDRAARPVAVSPPVVEERLAREMVPAVDPSRAADAAAERTAALVGW